MNVVSGLAGSGKTSVALTLGRQPFALTTAVSDALRTVLTEVADAVPKGTGEASALDVFVEAPRMVGPLEIASSLVETGDSPERLANEHAVRLGDLITVLDAERFWADLRSETLAPAAEEPDDSERTVGDLLVEQIEWASIIVINKTDLVPTRDAADIRDFVRLLNPAGHIVFAEHGEGSAEGWPPPRRDMFAWLQRSPGWVRQLNGDALEIAFFGRDLDARLLSANLDACLLTDAEFLAGPMFWSTLADPFPAWVIEIGA